MNDGSVSEDLYQFLAAYFHQDWDLEADDWQGIVDEYVNDDPASDPLVSLAAEIDNVRTARTEPELETLLDKIGVYYDPKPLTYNEWLSQIADRLRQHAAQLQQRDDIS